MVDYVQLYKSIGLPSEDKTFLFLNCIPENNYISVRVLYMSVHLTIPIQLMFTLTAQQSSMKRSANPIFQFFLYKAVKRPPTIYNLFITIYLSLYFPVLYSRTSIISKINSNQQKMYTIHVHHFLKY